jgi:hypothetical protein
MAAIREASMQGTVDHDQAGKLTEAVIKAEAMLTIAATRWPDLMGSRPKTDDRQKGDRLVECARIATERQAGTSAGEWLKYWTRDENGREVADVEVFFQFTDQPDRHAKAMAWLERSLKTAEKEVERMQEQATA